MLTLDRYIIRQVLVPTVAGLALLVLLFTAFTSVQLLRSAALGNLPPRDVLALVVAHDVSALEILVPSAFFAALIMVGCTWHREGEPYALYASGASPDRLSRPLRLLALVVALCVAGLSVYGRPYSYVLRYDISERAANLTSRHMVPQRFYRWDDNFVIQAQKILRREPNLEGVFARAETDGRPLVLRAEHGQISDTDDDRRQTLTFLDGTSYEIASPAIPDTPPEADSADAAASSGEGGSASSAVAGADGVSAAGAPDRVTRFERLVYRVQRPPSDTLSKRRARSTWELAGSTEPKDIAEFQWRLCMPLISFLVGLMAIELGRLRPRQSPYARFAAAIVLYAVVFNLSSITTSAVENGLLPRYPGVYTAVFIMGAFYLLLRRIPRLTLRVPA
jgi:lipopolysaccharide export system permease protein